MYNKRYQQQQQKVYLNSFVFFYSINNIIVSVFIEICLGKKSEVYTRWQILLCTYTIKNVIEWAQNQFFIIIIY